MIHSAHRLDRYTQLLLRLMRHGATWAHPAQLAADVGVSRSTVYRWLTVAEDNGVPIERARWPTDELTTGVRCLLVAKPRGAQ